VPVLTLKGNGFAGRVAASLLQAAGLPELVCETATDYIDKACRLAAGPRPTVSPWIDSGRFARDLESLYLRMWDRAVAGLPPLPIAADQPAA